MAKFSEVVGKFFKGSKPRVEIDPYGQWNPEQRAVGKQLGSNLRSYLTSGAPMYTGDFVAPLSADEQALVSNQARMNAITQPAFEELMSGKFPEEYFKSNIYDPMLKRYKEDIQPLVEEQYAGPGGYWGSARAEAVRKGYRDLTDTLTGERARLAEEARRLPLEAAPAYADYVQTAAGTLAIPTAVKQLGLDKEYAEWVRTRPENAEYLNAALNFLTLGSQRADYFPGSPSGLQQLGGYVKDIGTVVTGVKDIFRR